MDSRQSNAIQGSIEHVQSDTALLFFDVDGTLVWIDEDDLGSQEFANFGPNESVRRTFKKLRKNGHKAYLCTGRPRALIANNLHELGFDGYITGAGACIIIDDQIVHWEQMERNLVLEVAKQALKLTMPSLLESPFESVVLSQTGTPLFGFESLPLVQSVDELLEFDSELRFNKLSCVFSQSNDSPQAIEEFRSFMRQHFTEFKMDLDSVEYSPFGVDKGAGIGHVLELLGRSRSNTYAFGDSENDLPMFPAVETPIAMGNAMDVLKKEAAYVTGHASSDGIEQACRHFGLI